MSKCYINGTGCISAQRTFDTVFLEAAEVNNQENVLTIKDPVYKNYISPGAIRRMGKGVKAGIVASSQAMQEAGLKNVDAIITGTGMGCMEDSEKFLKAIIDNNESFLTPTSFIQSTHNTVGAQIALGLKCTGYNFTYVQNAVSFESSLLDASLQFATDEIENVLVGGIDETVEYTMSLFKLAGYIKAESEKPYQIFPAKSKGVVYGEGATFFLLENKITSSTYAELTGVEIINKLPVEEAEQRLNQFLAENDCRITDLDAVVLGYNGDIDDEIYFKNLAENYLKNITQLYYKHLSGAYHTASAFGLWLGAKIIKTQEIPAIVRANEIAKEHYNTILLYNHHKGRDHSFTLLKRCQSTT